MLRVKLFAKARELVGSPDIEITWEDGESVAVLRERLVESYPQLLPLVPRLLVAVNNDYAPDTATLKSFDEVACFPPVSGG